MKYTREVIVSHEFIRYADLPDAEEYIRIQLLQDLIGTVPRGDLENPHFLVFEKVDTLTSPPLRGWMDLNDPMSKYEFDNLMMQQCNKYRYTFITI